MKSTFKYLTIIFAVIIIIASCINEVKTPVGSSDAKTENVENHSNGDDIIANLSDESTNAEAENAANTSSRGGKVMKINTKEFIDRVYDYKANPGKWVFKGKRAAIIDFYADWCGPCKRVAPIMDKLAKDYDGKIDFYKINTDEEGELSGSVFGIRSIPSILIIPDSGQPMMYTGAFPEVQYVQIINEQLVK